MNKPELVELLTQELDISVKEASGTINIIQDSMTETLSKSENIELRGFGSFTSKNNDSYIGRNPKTGEKITVKARKAPVFKVGKELRNAVDGGRK